MASFGPVAAAPRAFLENHCLNCHDSDTRKGGIDLTGLAFDLKPAETFATWVNVYDLIASGEMPPPKKPRPPEAERTAVTRELATALVAADRARLGGAPRTATRRLTRSEYEQTVRDLFDMPGISVREFLPPDGVAHGFDNNADALDISHVNMASYMAAADHVLDAAIAIQPTAPAVQKQRMSLAGRGNAAFEAAMVGSCVLLKDKRLDPGYPVPSVFKHNEMSAHERLGGFSKPGTVGVLRQGDDFSPYLARPATIPRARASETGQKAISYHQSDGNVTSKAAHWAIYWHSGSSNERYGATCFPTYFPLDQRIEREPAVGLEPTTC
jgi:hypothetical protein